MVYLLTLFALLARFTRVFPNNYLIYVRPILAFGFRYYLYTPQAAIFGGSAG